MDPTADEIAGVADLFGGLTEAELGTALTELAFKAGEDVDSGAFEDAIAAARNSYHLVGVEREGAELLVPGPAAFPELPEGAEDLPHIMDVETRSVDRSDAVEAARARFEADAEAAIDAGDEDRIADLLDVSYDLEAWASVDLGAVRERLDAARE